jgi:hypothetical protein
VSPTERRWNEELYGKRFAQQYGANLSAFQYMIGNFLVNRRTRGFRPTQTSILLIVILREQITAVK